MPIQTSSHNRVITYLSIVVHQSLPAKRVVIPISSVNTDCVVKCDIYNKFSGLWVANWKKLFSHSMGSPFTWVRKSFVLYIALIKILADCLERDMHQFWTHSTRRQGRWQLQLQYSSARITHVVTSAVHSVANWSSEHKGVNLFLLAIVPIIGFGKSLQWSGFLFFVFHDGTKFVPDYDFQENWHVRIMLKKSNDKCYGSRKEQWTLMWRGRNPYRKGSILVCKEVE